MQVLPRTAIMDSWVAGKIADTFDQVALVCGARNLGSLSRAYFLAGGATTLAAGVDLALDVLFAFDILLPFKIWWPGKRATPPLPLTTRHILQHTGWIARYCLYRVVIWRASLIPMDTCVYVQW